MESVRPEGSSEHNLMSTTNHSAFESKQRRLSFPIAVPIPETQPESNYAGYLATARRAPSNPLIYLPHTLSEVTGPVFGHEKLRKPTTTSPGRQL